MKLLTINTHSLQEENYAQKLDQFVESILKERPDLIAMQEVNQTCDAALADPELLAGQYPIPGCMSVRTDNHAAQVARRLRKAGVACYWAWVPIKRGYDKYDEGVAVLSLGRKIACVDEFPVSRVNDYFNWRTRAVLGVQLEGLDDWFYTVHMGWWDDAEDGFFDQWKKLNCCGDRNGYSKGKMLLTVRDQHGFPPKTIDHRVDHAFVEAHFHIHLITGIHLEQPVGMLRQCLAG